MSEIYKNLVQTASGAFPQTVFEGAVLPAVAASLDRKGVRPSEVVSGPRAAIVVEAFLTMASLFLSKDQKDALAIMLGDALVEEVGGDIDRIIIEREDDIVAARQATKKACGNLGFGTVLQTKVVTVVSELARNIVHYAGSGAITVEARGKAIHVNAIDRGPGIPHIDEVLSGLYESERGLGMGLVGAQRLMDEFKVDTGPAGTHVRVVKYGH